MIILGIGHIKVKVTVGLQQYFNSFNSYMYHNTKLSGRITQIWYQLKADMKHVRSYHNNIQNVGILSRLNEFEIRRQCLKLVGLTE